MLADKRARRADEKSLFGKNVRRFEERVVVVAVAVDGENDRPRAVPLQFGENGSQERRHPSAVDGRAEYDDVVLPEHIFPFPCQGGRQIDDFRVAEEFFKQNLAHRADDLLRRMGGTEIHKREFHLFDLPFFYCNIFA